MKLIFALVFFLSFLTSMAQVLPDNTNPRNRRRPGTNTPGMPPLPEATVRKDTTGFKQRDDLADSITISYHYLDSTRRSTIDSSVNDFDAYFSIPSTYQHLGNNGAAAFPL